MSEASYQATCYRRKQAIPSQQAARTNQADMRPVGQPSPEVVGGDFPDPTVLPARLPVTGLALP